MQKADIGSARKQCYDHDCVNWVLAGDAGYGQKRRGHIAIQPAVTVAQGSKLLGEQGGASHVEWRTLTGIEASEGDGRRRFELVG